MKDNKQTIIYILLAVIVVMLVCIAVFVVPKFKEEPTPNVNPQPEPVENPMTPEFAVGNYMTTVSEGETGYNVVLYLREDGTFRFGIFGESITQQVGTYEVENGVTFTTKAYFDSNGCYFKEGSEVNADKFKPITVISSTSGSVTVSYSGQTYKLERSYTATESDEDLKTYVTNPVDGGMYSDCTDRDKV